MVGDELPAGYLKAGAEYVAAVEKLGLRPHLAGWGWHEAQHGWLLVIVTSIYDAGGPLELNKLLFKAYNAGATPQQISPFTVKVFSPEVVPKHYLEMQPGEHDMQSADPITNEVKAHFKGYLTIDLYGTKISGIHLIKTRFEKPRSYHANQREWWQFRRNVERLAA